MLEEAIVDDGGDARQDRMVSVRRREIILKAATRMFSEHGYQGASLRAIANECNLEKGHLYYYYPTKQELLFEVMQSLQSRYDDLLESTLGRGFPPMEALRSLLVGHVELLCSEFEVARISYESLRFLDAEHRAGFVSRRHAYEDGIRYLIDECRKEHAIHPTPTSLLSKVVLGIVIWPYQWYRPSGQLDPQELANTLADRAIASLHYAEGTRHAKAFSDEEENTEGDPG